MPRLRVQPDAVIAMAEHRSASAQRYIDLTAAEGQRAAAIGSTTRASMRTMQNVTAARQDAFRRY